MTLLPDDDDDDDDDKEGPLTCVAIAAGKKGKREVCQLMHQGRQIRIRQLGPDLVLLHFHRERLHQQETQLHVLIRSAKVASLSPLTIGRMLGFTTLAHCTRSFLPCLIIPT